MDNKKETALDEQYKIMTQLPILKLILKLSIPSIISMLITNIYNLADTAFVGQLGNSASGAVGVIFGFMSIIQAIGFMFGQGSGNLISGKLGHHDAKSANKIASTGFFSCLASGIVIAVLGFIFMDPLIMVLGSTDTIAPYAKTYMFYILLSTPVMTASFTLNNLLRYEGKTFLGMIGMLAGAILNICGDPILMFGLDMGIAGAGLSTALSQYVSFFILLSMFLRGKTISKLSVRYVSVSKIVLLNIVITGLPSLFRQGLSSLATVMLNAQSAAYGDEAVAAMSIVSRIIMFILAIAMGIGHGYQPISGFNYGAGKYGRVKKAFICVITLMEIVIAVAAVIVLFDAEFMISLFRNDAKVIEIGVRALRLQVVTLCMVPVCMCTEMLLQSTGRRWPCTLLASMRSGIYFVPALLILANLRGMRGIEESQPIAVVLAGVSAIPFMIHVFRDLSLKENSDRQNMKKC